MTAITSSMVKELREKTGAGMMDCKTALSEATGDFPKAVEWLRKKGMSKAVSKSSRVATEGLIGVGVFNDAQLGAAVEVNAETDFVARNDKFVELTHGMVRHIAQLAPENVEALLEQQWTDGKKVKDALTEMIAAIGENITIRRFARFQAPAEGTIGFYLHSNQRVGGLVEITGSQDAAARNLAKELAMQLVAMRPQYVTREQVPAEIIQKENEIYMAELKGDPKHASKPEAILKKIMAGKIEKFYEQHCLADQPWIKDDKKLVKQLIFEAGKQLQVTRMSRLEVGEGLEKTRSDLAAEVAKHINV